MAAVESEEQAQTLSQQSLRAIGEGLWDISSREGIDIYQVIRLTLVGNTAMLALLSGRNYELLLQPRYWTTPIDCLPSRTDVWRVAWDIHPMADIQVIPPLAGFVGSDILVGLVSTQAARNEDPTLLIDFGTNSEIALWNGESLWVTSAAGGPAFEGSGITCGLPVGPGAISRVYVDEDGIFQFYVVEGGQPRGICGSGLVDVIANLLKSGELSNIGRFTAPDIHDAFVIAGGEQDIVLTKADVDVFQRAKAAIGAGTEILLARADLTHAQLTRIYVSGAFGSYLDVANAQVVGLLPQIDPNLVELCGNTALAGCEKVLLSPGASEQVELLRDMTRIINLASCLDFDDVFLKHLYLQASP